MNKVLVLGAGGQIGTELVAALRSERGPENVWAADLRADALIQPALALDATDAAATSWFAKAFAKSTSSSPC